MSHPGLYLRSFVNTVHPACKANELLQELSTGRSPQVHGRKVRARRGGRTAVEKGAGSALAGGRHLGVEAGRVIIGGKFKFKFDREEGRRRRRSRERSGHRAAAPAPPLHRQPAANGWTRLSFGNCKR